jgi:glutamate formiminotransferase/formiminotetrahydrofolate cyclodeaminase
MELACASLETIRAMAETGNPNSVSDAGVGALCARTAVMGAWLNVRINAAGYDDKIWVERVLSRGKELETKTAAAEAEILRIVDNKISS